MNQRNAAFGLPSSWVPVLGGDDNNKNNNNNNNNGKTGDDTVLQATATGSFPSCTVPTATA